MLFWRVRFRALRSEQVSFGEAKHFPARSRSQRRYAPMVVGIRRVNRLGTEIKSRARLRITQQSLNCHNVFALLDKKVLSWNGNPWYGRGEA
jgi:hypothetical protein